MHENAKIWAESEGEGKGCTFFVRFPVHSHRALEVPSREKSIVDSIDLLTSLVVDPIHEFAPIDSSSDACQLALAAESLIQHVSGKDSGKGSPPKVPSPLVVPVVAVWKPTIMVVDDSSMNRKVVDACLTYPIISHHPPSLTRIRTNKHITPLIFNRCSFVVW